MQQTLQEILELVKAGRMNIEEAITRLQSPSSQEIEGACIDHQRALRTGIPEIIYGASKEAEQIISIAQAILQRKEVLLATRVEHEKADIVLQALPGLTYHKKARILCGNPKGTDRSTCRGDILIICAGTSDIPVAEEARVTAEALGHPVIPLYDVGVAGLHRLMSRQGLISSAAVIIVVAGMEGALPSVVAGLATAPVIGVPTSIGYGANLGGFSALLGMLNSCAPGLAVVNIDNGFGAACMALAINHR